MIPKRILKQQSEIKIDFMVAYGFKDNQIGFDGESLEPIFDFDALSVLSARLCDLPHVAVDFGEIQHPIGLATSTGYAQLENGNTRKIFGSAQVGEVMPDGTAIADIHQAVKVSRARAMRTIHRMVGFDPVRAHKEFRRTGNVVPLQPRSEKEQRNAELAEIHMLAKQLKLIDGSSRRHYENFLLGFFGKASSADLPDQQRSEWLAILRAWARARATANDNDSSNAA